MDSLLALLNWIGSILGWFWGNRFDVQISRLMRDLLNDPNYKLRNFNTLLDAAAVYDEEPNDLRRVLISIGARRYKGIYGEELWGFPRRNENNKSEEPYPYVRVGAFIAGGIAIVITAFFAYSITRDGFLSNNMFTGIFSQNPDGAHIIVNDENSRKFQELVESGRVTAAGTGGRTAHNLVEISAEDGFVFDPESLEFEEASREGGGSIWHRFRTDLYEYKEILISYDSGQTFQKTKLPERIAIELHAETGSGMSNFNRSSWLNGHVKGREFKILE